MTISWWKWLCGALMIYVIYGAFFIAKGAVNFVGTGDVARIVFFHVPVAVLSSVCFFFGAYFAYRVLSVTDAVKAARLDSGSVSAMELGFLASVLATITGSIFAQAQWHSYWNWDPREVSIVGLLVIYAAYLLLRGAVRSNPTRRAQLSAVYALVTVIPATFLIWVVPRIPALQTLHPTTVLTDANSTSGSYKLVLLSAFVAFALLFHWMYQLNVRAHRVRQRGEARS